ncbi:MAG: ComEA family DNA-binding protein [Microbacteriaceae bacterium]
MTASDPRVRLRIGAGAALVLVVVALGVGVAASALSQGGGARTVVPVTAVPTASVAGAGTVVVVHVLGAVRSPGLYTLAAGARVVDAVAAAGGFGDDAEQASVNLARELVDGEQLTVLAVGETPAAGTGATGTGTTGTGLVDLNTADQATLETLPGIGPALAQRIIAWREQNGGFATVDDLLSVSGIGEVTFAGLESLVTV